jgi:hypothetical protein
MRKLTVFLLSGAIAVALNSCAGTYKLEHSVVLNKTTLSNYKTFTITPFETSFSKPKKGKAGLSEEEYVNLSNGIRNEMTARGYSEDPASELKISFNLFVERNADITTNLYPDYYYGSYGMYRPYVFRRSYNGYTSTRIYKQGIWVINMVTSPQNTLLYSAAISAEISPKTLTLKSPDEINKASAVMFKKFPVKPVKQ